MKSQDIYVAHPETDEQVAALKTFMQALKIKFEISKKKEYHPELESKIEKSRKQYKNKEFVTVEKKGLKKFLGRA